MMDCLHSKDHAQSLSGLSQGFNRFPSWKKKFQICHWGWKLYSRKANTLRRKQRHFGNDTPVSYKRNDDIVMEQRLVLGRIKGFKEHDKNRAFLTNFFFPEDYDCKFLFFSALA